jgi:hypothetical protein
MNTVQCQITTILIIQSYAIYIAIYLILYLLLKLEDRNYPTQNDGIMYSIFNLFSILTYVYHGYTIFIIYVCELIFYCKHTSNVFKVIEFDVRKILSE